MNYPFALRVFGSAPLWMLLVASVALLWVWPLQEGAYAADGARLIAPRTQPAEQRYVFDIDVGSREELLAILQRAELLSQDYSPETVSAIALILHGPELAYFDLRDYTSNREIIDLASRLDARKVIEIKACRTMLERLMMKPGNLPGYIEVVPFGPAEVKRLVGEGYIQI
jgi:intracellular sulfur oxidation DsrE/DsrF family protein